MGSNTGMRIAMASVIVVVGLLVSPAAAFACTCRDTRPTTADDYKRWLQTFPGIVFQGQATKVEPLGNAVAAAEDPASQPMWKVAFTVERQWKGVRTRDLIVS